MAPRPRRITNTQLLVLASRVVSERGAGQTRLSDVAAVSGLAPATLLQRFGSLEGLLDAVSAAYLEQVLDAFTAYEASPIGVLQTSLTTIAAARHTIFLAARPAGAAAYSLELRKQIAFSLVGAVEAGELMHGDVATLARRIQIEFYGLTTAALLEGTVVDEKAVSQLLRGVLGDLM